MYFWDEKKRKLVKNCPSCKSIFIPNKGTKCLATCPAKKLEAEHKKITEKMIASCFPKRKIIKKMYELRDKYKTSLIEEYELINYYEEHQKIVDEYQKWEGHDYNPWYLEYLKFHKKLTGSAYRKYAYGKTKPNPYGFNEKGEGKYKPRERTL